MGKNVEHFKIIYLKRNFYVKVNDLYIYQLVIFITPTYCIARICLMKLVQSVLKSIPCVLISFILQYRHYGKSSFTVPENHDLQ